MSGDERSMICEHLSRRMHVGTDVWMPHLWSSQDEPNTMADGDVLLVPAVGKQGPGRVQAAVEKAAKLMKCSVNRGEQLDLCIQNSTGDIVQAVASDEGRSGLTPLHVTLYTLEGVDPRRNDLCTLVGLARAQLEGLDMAGPL